MPFGAILRPRRGELMHIHLDPVGGIAGDMFIAALLNAFPDQVDGTIAAASRLAPVGCALVAHRDHALAGARFSVTEAGRDHHQNHHPGHAHWGHAHWSDIRAAIAGCDLPEAVRGAGLGIFTHLAEAEARVHGIELADVAFHEVGAADSIADILGAAWLIAGLGVTSWSVGALPLGSGLVQTAHGRLPVPAPATALLLEGLAVHDDGVPGERVTPTGAAILRYLRPGARPAGRVGRQGIGFGSRELPGVSNCLRVLAVETGRPPAHRELLVVSFEVDDQSPEDLACGVGRLRAMPVYHPCAGFGGP